MISTFSIELDMETLPSQKTITGQQWLRLDALKSKCSQLKRVPAGKVTTWQHKWSGWLN
jgi:hypothetical protein